MVIPLELAEELLVPVPRPFQAEVPELVDELLDDPLVHELLERVGAVLQRRVVVHRQPGEQREDVPAPPEHVVDQLLRDVLLAVLDQDLDRRLTLLRVPGLIGLDRGDQRAEVEIPDVHRVRGHAQELQVGEAGLEGEGELDRRGHRIVGGEHVVEQVPGRDRAPLVGVQGLVRPVHPGLFVQQGIGEVGLDLAVPGLVQAAERGHVAPRGGPAEPAHPGLPDARQVLRDGDRPVVRDDRRLPARVELIEHPGPADHRVHRVHARVLAHLVVHVLGVGDLVRLVPAPPALGRDTVRVRQLLRPRLLLVHVGQGPVHVPGEVVPLGSSQSGHASSVHAVLGQVAAPNAASPPQRLGAPTARGRAEYVVRHSVSPVVSARQGRCSALRNRRNWSARTRSPAPTTWLRRATCTNRVFDRHSMLTCLERGSICLVLCRWLRDEDVEFVGVTAAVLLRLPTACRQAANCRISRHAGCYSQHSPFARSSSPGY